jgi:hypothetical protein
MSSQTRYAGSADGKIPLGWGERLATWTCMQASEAIPEVCRCQHRSPTRHDAAGQRSHVARPFLAMEGRSCRRRADRGLICRLLTSTIHSAYSAHVGASRGASVCGPQSPPFELSEMHPLHRPASVGRPVEFSCHMQFKNIPPQSRHLLCRMSSHSGTSSNAAGAVSEDVRPANIHARDRRSAYHSPRQLRITLGPKSPLTPQPTDAPLCCALPSSSGAPSRPSAVLCLFQLSSAVALRGAPLRSKAGHVQHRLTHIYFVVRT